MKTIKEMQNKFTTTVSYEDKGMSVYETINLEVLENYEVDIQVEYRKGNSDLVKYGFIEHINCFSISSLFNDGERIKYENIYLPHPQSTNGCLQFIVKYLKTLHEQSSSPEYGQRAKRIQIDDINVS